jgi:hypothetical protein
VTVTGAAAVIKLRIAPNRVTLRNGNRVDLELYVRENGGPVDAWFDPEAATGPRRTNSP